MLPSPALSTRLFELRATDPSAVKHFCGVVLGWWFRLVPGSQSAWRVYGRDSGDPIGMLVRAPLGETPLAPVVLVSFLDLTLASVVRHGGSITTGREWRPGLGWTTVVSDPSGNAFILAEAGECRP